MTDPRPVPPSTLGLRLQKARADAGLSLRQVEEATGGTVSNAYLCQLENDKIKQPSPHILYDLSLALGVAYETLMECAGYIPPAPATPARLVTEDALADMRARAVALRQTACADVVSGKRSHDYAVEWLKLDSEHTRLIDALVGAREALQKYGVHLYTCRARAALADQRDCDCGFASAHLATPADEPSDAWRRPVMFGPATQSCPVCGATGQYFFRCHRGAICPAAPPSGPREGGEEG